MLAMVCAVASNEGSFAVSACHSVIAGSGRAGSLLLILSYKSVGIG
jgi:hypothetical protein